VIYRAAWKATILALALSAGFSAIMFNQFAKAQEIELGIQLKDMNGWPGGTGFGIWEGGWEANLYFNISANQCDVTSVVLCLHMYAKTTGYSKAILDNLQLNGYVLEKDWTFAYDWWGSGAERDEWINWTVSKEFIRTGQNHLFIGLYFTDLDDLYTEDFVVYDLSRIVLQVRDATAPYTSVLLNGVKLGNDLYTSDVLVTLSAEDSLSGVSSIFFRLDSENQTQYETPFEVSGDGSHVVCYYSVDRMGNQESERRVSFRIDITPPRIFIEKPPNYSYFANASVIMSWNGTDELGIDHYTVCLDGIDKGNTSLTSWDFGNLDEGEHVMSVIAHDQAGHYNESRVRITVDFSNPNVSLIYPHSADSIWGVVTLKASADDYLSGIGRVETIIDNTANGNMTFVNGIWVSQLDTCLLSGGSHTICVKAIDRAGNFQFSEINVVIRKLQVDAMFSDQSVTEGDLLETKVLVTDQEGNRVNGAQVFLTFDGMTIAYADGGDGVYEKVINTTGLVNALNIISQKVEVNISASKDTYNSGSQTYQIIVHRRWDLLNLVWATFSGLTFFYLPLPSLIRLVGKRQFCTLFSYIVGLSMGFIAGYAAYHFPQFMPYVIVIPSMILVATFSIAGFLVTLFTLIRRTRARLRSAS
jgi:hypothetical protein